MANSTTVLGVRMRITPRVPASCECGHQRIPGVGRRRRTYLHGIAGVRICTASPSRYQSADEIATPG